MSTLRVAISRSSMPEGVDELETSNRTSQAPRTPSGRRPMGRPTALVVGVVLILAGIPMLVCPGPGILTMLTGAGLVLYAITGRSAQR